MESLRQFDRRERQYPLPQNGTPEEVIKATLKSWRTPARFALSVRGPDATSGRTIPDALAFALDVRRLTHRLPQPHKAIVLLYFVAARPPHRPGDGDDCTWCAQHYGNPEVARDLAARGYALSPRSVGQLKRAAISQIAVTLFPHYYRGKKARRGV